MYVCCRRVSGGYQCVLSLQIWNKMVTMWVCRRGFFPYYYCFFLVIIHSTDVQLCYMHFCFVLFFFYLDMIKCCMCDEGRYTQEEDKKNEIKNIHRTIFASKWRRGTMRNDTFLVVLNNGWKYLFPYKCDTMLTF